MAEYIFTPTGGRVSSDNELPRPLFVPADEVGRKQSSPKPKRPAARKAKPKTEE